MDDRDLRGTVTKLLSRVEVGDAEAFDQLVSLVHEDLHRRASALMRRERAGHTLQPTALVNEAYLRLVDQTGIGSNRRHFLAIAARSMRQILLDHARRRHAEKRGGDRQRVPLETKMLGESDGQLDALTLDDALRELEELDERKARVVELRFFGGLSVEETASVLEVDARTVKRDWRVARAMLLDRLERD